MSAPYVPIVLPRRTRIPGKLAWILYRAYVDTDSLYPVSVHWTKQRSQRARDREIRIRDEFFSEGAGGVTPA